MFNSMIVNEKYQPKISLFLLVTRLHFALLDFTTVTRSITQTICSVYTILACRTATISLLGLRLVNTACLTMGEIICISTLVRWPLQWPVTVLVPLARVSPPLHSMRFCGVMLRNTQVQESLSLRPCAMILLVTVLLQRMNRVVQGTTNTLEHYYCYFQNYLFNTVIISVQQIIASPDKILLNPCLTYIHA